MTAWQADSMGRDDLEITIYTHESAPLEVFGAAATTALREDLDAAGIAVETDAYVLAARTGGSSSSRARGRSATPASSRFRARSARH